MLRHQFTCCGKQYGNARGLATHRSCSIKYSHDFGTTLRSTLLAPQNTAFGAKNHAFGQDSWTMTRRCRGAVESDFDVANKGDDILGFTLDPVYVGGDEKGLQDSVPAINLGLSINPNNQHIGAIGEVLYTHANIMKINFLSFAIKLKHLCIYWNQFLNGLLRLQILVLALVLLDNLVIVYLR